MTKDEIRAVIIKEIGEIAPEVETGTVSDSEDLRDALDMDSMDIFNLIAALHLRLSVDIPDRAAAEFATIEGAAAWLADHLQDRNS
ncbi:acyl carrier protein [Altererythrobacter sp. ZODW24]|uniref:acyl carrier protein n=1 Tax=Altererythrobacter sp. ZODW24 TaxID=2185142 RepID=UPI000DF84DE9|nr:acyl carrier protein [Altererythrobacter sp. ZODW24]